MSEEDLKKEKESSNAVVSITDKDGEIIEFYFTKIDHPTDKNISGLRVAELDETDYSTNLLSLPQFLAKIFSLALQEGPASLEELGVSLSAEEEIKDKIITSMLHQKGGDV